MANKKGGLGRGLGALLTQTAAQYNKTQDTVVDIEVALIVPNRYQPRREFDSDALAELAESIKTYGILQPLIVRKTDSGYELIAGERRLRASKSVGLDKVPAIIRDYSDAQMSEISIIENVQRENLNVIEEAQAYDRLIKEFGHTQEVVAVKIGRSRSHISNILRLLKLTPEVRELVSKGKLTLGQARPLLAIDNPIIQKQAADMILSEGLSVRKVEAFINELKNSGLLASLSSDMYSAENNSANSDSKPVEIIEPVKTADTNKPAEPLNNIETAVVTAEIAEAADEGVEIDTNSVADTHIDKISTYETVAKTVDKAAASDKINIVKPVEEPVKFAAPYTPSAPDDLTGKTDIYIREAENRLTNILGAKVHITSGKKNNRIQIDFSSEEELSRIVETFDQSLMIMSGPKNTLPAASTKEEKIAALRRFSTQNFNI